jgi:hypothetical protein
MSACCSCRNGAGTGERALFCHAECSSKGFAQSRAASCSEKGDVRGTCSPLKSSGENMLGVVSIVFLSIAHHKDVHMFSHSHHRHNTVSPRIPPAAPSSGILRRYRRFALWVDHLWPFWAFGCFAFIFYWGRSISTYQWAVLVALLAFFLSLIAVHARWMNHRQRK